MRIATWNVNSIRARAERLLAFLERHRPDVLCLQELKVGDDAFPMDLVVGAGYQAVVHGQKTYNGVAILSRQPATDVVCGLVDDVDDPQARLVAATVAGVRVLSAYVPNGKEVGTESFAYKLRWLTRLRAYLDRHGRPELPLALCGDFNCAPDDRDVAFPDRWLGSVLTAAEVRAAVAEVAGFGLHDVHRKFHDGGGQFSWWDYRMLAFPKGDGLRIDQIWVTAPLLDRCTAAQIDRDERKGKQPSDHAPVLADFT